MQTIIHNASKYDWSTWAMGIMRSFIAAGAGAVASPTGSMVLDPKDFNLGSGIGKVLISMAIGFGVSGIVGMGIFLKTHGAPDQLQAALATAAASNAAAGDAIATAQQSTETK